MSESFDILKNEWHQLMAAIKEEFEISDAAFRAWIVPLKPLKIKDGTLYIYFRDTDSLSEEYLNKKFRVPFKVFIEERYGIYCDIYFTNNDFTATKTLDEAFFRRNNLNPKYTFDTFIKGANNDMALAASMRVASSPKTIYNPLFIYGGPGLGKTHLMNAIAYDILTNRPKLNVIYVTSEEFTNELIESIRTSNRSSVAFRKKYRSADVLLIDDIQFIIGKESTQEEFFHTFNALYGANKQIIISSDKPPKDFETLPERLRSRFQTGIMADIQKPNYEMRMAILQQYVMTKETRFSQDILEYIALNVKSNIRELEGAFNTLEALANIKEDNNAELTLDKAKDYLKNIINPDINVEITPEFILEVVADHYNVDVKAICGQGRNSQIVSARHVAMYLCSTLTNATLAEIARILGNRHHTTVINGRDKIMTKISASSNFAHEIEALEKKIQPTKPQNIHNVD
ncbi:MAG: chromosomal replication initiator protein DnaA [Eubacteriales bacterium]|nr:chromosomal replication initiator protein DnaA [Eubacteriales bacterium]